MSVIFMGNFMQFEFTEQEANVILAGLAQMPYNQVVSLINNIQIQWQRNSAAAQTEATKDVTPLDGPQEV